MKAENVSRRIADASVTIGLTMALVWAFVWAQPVRRGFYCNDTSIQYPYRSDTVTFRMILVMLVPIPFLLLFFVEMLSAIDAAKFTNCKKSDNTLELCVEESSFTISDDVKMTSPNDRRRNPLSGSTLMRLCIIALRNTLRIGLLFWFGLIITMGITEVGKLGVGRLRPHFMDVCRPTGYNCSQGYVTEYQCQNENSMGVLQARKSFPSGHASGTAYVALFLAIHIQRRMPVYRAMGLLLRPLLQVALLTMAFYSGLSRVPDNKHHPSDVTVGTIIGVLCAGWLMWSVHKHVVYLKFNRKAISNSTTNEVV